SSGHYFQRAGGIASGRPRESALGGVGESRRRAFRRTYFARPETRRARIAGRRRGWRWRHGHLFEGLGSASVERQRRPHARGLSGKSPENASFTVEKCFSDGAKWATTPAANEKVPNFKIQIHKKPWRTSPNLIWLAAIAAPL